MVRIAVVEDEAACSEKICSYLRQYENEKNEHFEITAFTDGDEITENYKAEYDIILMDIQMRFMDGMSAAEAIREMDSEVVIIFITNMAQYAIRGYAVDALDYVLKPVSYFAFSQRLERAISRMEKRKGTYLAISLKGTMWKVDVSKVLYVESQGHNLLFHMAGDVCAGTGTMKEIEEKLAPHHFFRCNKGYLVNMEYVEGIQDGCAVVHGEKLLISRARKADFMEALTQYVSGMVK